MRLIRCVSIFEWDSHWESSELSMASRPGFTCVDSSLWRTTSESWYRRLEFLFQVLWWTIRTVSVPSGAELLRWDFKHFWQVDTGKSVDRCVLVGAVLSPYINKSRVSAIPRFPWELKINENEWTYKPVATILSTPCFPRWKAHKRILGCTCTLRCINHQRNLELKTKVLKTIHESATTMVITTSFKPPCICFLQNFIGSNSTLLLRAPHCSSIKSTLLSITRLTQTHGDCVHLIIYDRHVCVEQKCDATYCRFRKVV